MRALAILLISLVTALAAIGLAVAAPGHGHDPARASLQAAGGSLSIDNSRAGAAVISAGDLRPGDSVDGTVTIGNDGDVAGRFALDVVDVVDTPGPAGGALSGRVVLTVDDLTAGMRLYSGAPADFAETDVGTLGPADEHEFLLTLSWPAGLDDNSYQGSALSLGLSWRAGVAGGPCRPRPRRSPSPSRRPPRPRRRPRRPLRLRR